MTTTAVASRMIGKCFTCKRTYVAESTEQAATMFCTCRATVACRYSHTPGDAGHTHPVSAVKWATIKATHSSRKCSSACTSAKSEGCTCECDGRNHGRDWEL